MTFKLIIPLTFAFLFSIVFAGKPANNSKNTAPSTTAAAGQKKRGNTGKSKNQAQQDEFQEYAIFANKSANPESGNPTPTILPLKITKGSM